MIVNMLQIFIYSCVFLAATECLTFFVSSLYESSPTVCLKSKIYFCWFWFPYDSMTLRHRFWHNFGSTLRQKCLLKVKNHDTEFRDISPRSHKEYT